MNLFVYEDEPAKRARLRYLKGLLHWVKTIRFDLPLDEGMRPYLTDRPGKREIRDQFMIRIASIKGIDGLAVDANDMSVAIEVSDRQASRNAGIWRWTVGNGVLRVEPSDRADLRCGIGPLSSVLSGFTDLSGMTAVGRVEPLPSYVGEDLPRAITFLADCF